MIMIDKATQKTEKWGHLKKLIDINFMCDKMIYMHVRQFNF